MSELDWETLLDVVIKIAQKAGEKETLTELGRTGTVWTYEDPWGGGLVLRYGIMGDNGTWRASAENVTAGIQLLDVMCKNGQKYLLAFDRTTAWDMYLYACRADVVAKYGEID